MLRVHYGLRRQLLLNLGVVMILSFLGLGLVVIQVARARFVREQYRHLHVVAHLIHQTVLTRMSNRSPRPIDGLLSIPGGYGKTSRPQAALVMLPNGKIWKQYGTIPKSVNPMIKRWLSDGRPDFLTKIHREKTSVFDRVVVLRLGLRPIGILWLRWDLGPMEREFFSFQALLYLYLLLFCLVILAILIVFLEKRLVSPLHRLREAFQRLTEGRSSGGLALEVIRGDEIGAISTSFLEMERVLQKQAKEREGYIAELKEANATLERAQLELVEREKMATIGRMAAGVAHEVGNPLSAIMGYSDLLRSSDTWTEVERDLAERVYKETKRIDGIIRELLDFSRPVDIKEPGDPRRAIEETIELLELQKRFGGMEVKLELEASLPLVKLSSPRLVQVLLNLLLNAADASKQEGHIVIEGRMEGEEVWLSVTDDGPGIEPDAKGRLFEPFFTTKAPGEGIGLGLALCHRWVTSTGGSLEVDDTYTDGAKFFIKLPILGESID
ncbi:MAG: hypothetical protein CL920_01235 [Deltaproteobacteria bacterium]|nr:hypothetical protein [Deltaproteobacteria bacterium]MBU47304.1 hypothetical protein [Deltaproteobacteria bacterium]